MINVELCICEWIRTPPPSSTSYGPDTFVYCVAVVVIETNMSQLLHIELLQLVPIKAVFLC